MTSNSQFQGFKQTTRTPRTGSTNSIPSESPLGTTPRASALCARVWRALEPLKASLCTSFKTGEFLSTLSTRNSVKNPRTLLTGCTGTVPLEFTSGTTHRASALCARVQIALESLSSDPQPLFGSTEATLHSIGNGKVIDPVQPLRSIWVFAPVGAKPGESVCFARRYEATNHRDMRVESCRE